MAVISCALIYKIVELIFTLISLLLIAIPPWKEPNYVYCTFSHDWCFAELLYPFVLGLLTTLFLIGMIHFLTSGRMLPTADCTIPFIGAALWYAAGGTVIYVVAGKWISMISRSPSWPLIAPPAQWCAAAAFCLFTAVAYTIEGIAVCYSPHSYQHVFYPSPVPFVPGVQDVY